MRGEPRIAELTALRQLSEGTITVHDGGYVLKGRPVTGDLAHALIRLHTADCLTLGTAGPGGNRPVQTTPAGTTRLAELGRQHG